jgi:chromosome segregation ATPase
MARPLSTSDPYRGGMNGNHQVRYTLESDPPDAAAQELEHLRSENEQLRSLCAELEQALQEASQQVPDLAAQEERFREYEALLEEKTETIRLLHQQVQETQAALEEAGQRPGGRKQGPVPREDELLQLSEDLERERRQIQEDEQALMEQMRQMEMSMARERADMARQRNDLQRLFGEVRHEMERLERNGALQSKMEELKAKLQDVQNRRGGAPTTANRPASSTSLPTVPPAGAPPAPTKRESFMGRFFGNKQ